ncbi:MAG: serine hydrolase domain-containing protein [Candidatus Limnocylindrales bacterium]
MEADPPPVPARRARLRRSGAMLAAASVIVGVIVAGGRTGGERLSAQALPLSAAAHTGGQSTGLGGTGAAPAVSVGSAGSAGGNSATTAIIPTVVPTATLQAQLDALRVKYHVPGVSVTIIWPDGTTWTGVSGLANLTTKAPVVPGTAFSIGSITKTFMAALILQLQQEHRLSLNDRITKWLPHAKVLKGDTIRWLLDQTSGLYDFFANPRIDTAILANKRAHWTAARALRYMRGPYCHSASCWHYSNSNYVILGQLVRRVTGHSAATEIRRRFLDPLALSRTFAQGVEARRGTVATSYALVGPMATVRRVSLSDGTAISPYTSVVTAAGDAGDMAASSVDLAHWARALYAGPVLQPASLAAMLDVSHSIAVKSHYRYGLGMFQVTIDGHRTVGHDGRLDGARASIRYMPDTGFTIAVATNQDRTGPDVFGASLLKIAMAPPPPPPPPPAPEPLPSGDLASPSGELASPGDLASPSGDPASSSEELASPSDAEPSSSSDVASPSIDEASPSGPDSSASGAQPSSEPGDSPGGP